MATVYDDLLAKVEESGTVQDSLIALTNSETGIIATLKDELAKALSGETVSPAIQEAIDKVTAAAQSNMDKANAAVVANTPAA